MKIKILKKDFDRAIKQPWSTDSCLIAQAVKREFGDLDQMYRVCEASPEADVAMGVFDNSVTRPREMPNAKLDSMQKLRASLPIIVEMP